MKKYSGDLRFARANISQSRLPYILQAAHVTEKATAGTQVGCYTFKVHPQACKSEIRMAVETCFKVRVVNVNTLNIASRKRLFRGIKGRVAGYKKAMVTLEKGSVIDSEKGVM